MAEWKVVYQDTPFNFTSASALLIEAEGIEQALATAYDHLTRNGKAVRVINTDGADIAKLSALLGPNVNPACMPVPGNTHIRSCVLHLPTGLGRVVAS